MHGRDAYAYPRTHHDGLFEAVGLMTICNQNSLLGRERLLTSHSRGSLTA